MATPVSTRWCSTWIGVRRTSIINSWWRGTRSSSPASSPFPDSQVEQREEDHEFFLSGRRAIVFYQGEFMLLMRFVVSMFWGGLAALATGIVAAQDYPSKPIRI